MKIDRRQFTVKLAETEAEMISAQRLRYRVFVEEMGAKVSENCHLLRQEIDDFDADFDHLVLVNTVVEDPLDQVVGVYRLLQGSVAKANKGFYGASEFDLKKLSDSPRECVELGRSCVDQAYRGGVAMHLLWNGLAEYVLSREIDIMFGTASFPGTDPEAVSQALSYLHHMHLAPEDIRVSAMPEHRIEMGILDVSTIDATAAKRQVPALIQAYVRLGGFVGDGAWIDHAFNTIDVCLIMDTQRMSEKHKSYYIKGYEK